MNSNTNKEIILQVFKEVRRHLQEDSLLLKKCEMVQGFDDEWGLREKGAILIECYPWVISKDLSRLFSAEYLLRGDRRLLKIFEVTERIAQFTAFSWLIQLWEYKKANTDLELSSDFHNQFKQFHKPTIGVYLGLIRACSQLLSTNKTRRFLNFKGVEYYTGNLLSSLETMIVYRNREFHFKSGISCDEAEKHLADILCSVAYLVKFPLVSVRNINVKKPRFEEAIFSHSLFLLNSQRPDFLGENVQIDSFSDSHSVLLIENAKLLGSYLSLSPFVIDTKPFFSDRSRQVVMPGLYIYSGKTRNRIDYSFVNSAEINTLAEMPIHESLEAQWDDMFKTLAP